MIPFFSRILSDNESLREYEEQSLYHPDVTKNQVMRRLIAQERQEGLMKPDVFYEGFSKKVFDGENFNCIIDIIVNMARKFGNIFLERHNNIIYTKAQEFKSWSGMITRIPPLWMIAGYMLDEFDLNLLQNSVARSGMLSKLNLLQFQYTAMTAPYIPDLQFLVERESGLDDLHIHLNGTTETDMVWIYILRHSLKTYRDFAFLYKKDDKVKQLAEQVYPGLTPVIFVKFIDHAKELRSILLKSVEKTLGIPTVPQTIISDQYLTAVDIIRKLNIPVANQWEYKTTLTEELLFYLLVMKMILQNQSELMAQMFHHYMLIKGMVHRFLVMQKSQVGFSQFQLLTISPFREGVESQYEKRFIQLAGTTDFAFLRTVEGRFSPRSTSFSNRQLVSKIVDGYNRAKKTCPDSLSKTNLTLIAHFIKQKDYWEKGDKTRHLSLRRDLKRKAIALNSFMKRDKSRYGKYIHGVDAAASEFDAGPEVFASCYRYLRGMGIHHFTFHVGEDFRHLISGLRSIYEAIEFLELQTGDRLGHCTAIGISPALWKEKVGDVIYISSGEWLDDLVFVWHIITESLSESLQLISLRLESEIAKLSMQIYGETCHPYELRDAWLLRRYCPIPELNDFTPQFFKNSKYSQDELTKKLSNHIGYRLWMAYHTGYIHNSSEREFDVRKNYESIIRVPINSFIDDDTLLAIQHIILELMAQRNIVIEALPSSNIHISYYEALKEYHLKRWLDTEQADCMMPSVVLGTDDPGIFMTNIYNEYAMAYLHLGDNKMSPSKRLNVITNLQRFSEIYRFYTWKTEKELA